ncbi:uncharacterized protein LOC126885432 [Diabrotica virgifera virgifera]|uniref:Uncharacterized protein n=1 Tax=Diabrotica virgifera virgifera TaxID=50390 RepID=A0ABM5KCP0_DIAVI|nr:uncharacterized protein LOC126885432 [Diabrotica virgifera virgifera]
MSAKCFLLIAFVLMCSLVDARPTHCERWNGDKEFRCLKDNHKADKVAIHNKTDHPVTFKVEKWLSKCGSPGQKYSDLRYGFVEGATITIDVSEVKPGSCHEMFISKCKTGSSNVNCLDVITATPVL